MSGKEHCQPHAESTGAPTGQRVRAADPALPQPTPTSGSQGSAWSRRRQGHPAVSDVTLEKPVPGVQMSHPSSWRSYRDQGAWDLPGAGQGSKSGWNGSPHSLGATSASLYKLGFVELE